MTATNWVTTCAPSLYAVVWLADLDDRVRPVRGVLRAQDRLSLGELHLALRDDVDGLPQRSPTLLPLTLAPRSRDRTGDDANSKPPWRPTPPRGLLPQAAASSVVTP